MLVQSSYYIAPCSFQSTESKNIIDFRNCIIFFSFKALIINSAYQLLKCRGRKNIWVNSLHERRRNSLDLGNRQQLRPLLATKGALLNMCKCWRTYSFRGVHCSPASTSVWKVRVPHSTTGRKDGIPWSEHFVVPVRLSRQFWISDKSYKSVIKLEKSVSDVLVAFISSISRCFDGTYFFDSRYSRSLRRRSFSVKRISFECT